ncbi:MAG: hypothetical protein JNK41_12235 [Saprospiraceae bacterium]|nr:hypothetical protein [Saprospiraceae bacterium]
MKKKIIYIIFTLTVIFVGCKSDRDDLFNLGTPPDPPQFTIEPLDGDSSSRFLVKDLSTGNFQRLWSFKGGIPATSNKAIDTVSFSKIGEYPITLYVSKSNGSGTSYSTKKVNVLKDAPLVCSPKLALLTGDCSPVGKCWTLSHEAGAVKVGPTYDDYSWYTSPVDGLQKEQYDDGFCFTFEGFVFQYKNNVATVNPWNGYKAEAYDPGISTFAFLEGTGINGRDQILLPDDQFMGVWDSDNLLDIVMLTESKLVVRTRQREQKGTPKAEGWFELVFVKQ